MNNLVQFTVDPASRDANEFKNVRIPLKDGAGYITFSNDIKIDDDQPIKMTELRIFKASNGVNLTQIIHVPDSSSYITIHEYTSDDNETKYNIQNPYYEQMKRLNTMGLQTNEDLPPYMLSYLQNENSRNYLMNLNLENEDAYENLLNYLMVNDPNHYGNPPTSKEIINKLRKMTVDKEFLEKHKENVECAICKEEFQLDNIVVEIKCGHIFNEECILEWLKLHNNCPVCRVEYETDDYDYENKKKNDRMLLTSIKKK